MVTAEVEVMVEGVDMEVVVVVDTVVEAVEWDIMAAVEVEEVVEWDIVVVEKEVGEVAAEVCDTRGPCRPFWSLLFNFLHQATEADMEVAKGKGTTTTMEVASVWEA